MDTRYINKNYLEESIKNYDTTIIDPVRNVVNDIYYNTADELNVLTQLIVALIPSSSYSPAAYWNVISASLPNTFKGIRYTTPEDTTGYNISSGSTNAVYAKVNGDYLELSSNLLVIDALSQRIFNSNMGRTFWECSSLNQNILIPNSVTNMWGTFYSCNNLNQNILIPNSVEDMGGTFCGCSSLNQNILIPNSVTNMHITFSDCIRLNQNILIPNSVTNMQSTFAGCRSLNQNILIPNTVVNIGLSPNTTEDGLFCRCTRLNQPIAIPNSVEDMRAAFDECTSLNQEDMYIYSQNITNMANAYNGVQYIGNIHVPTSVPKDETNVMYNSLVNGYTGYTFAPENIINDLPVDIAQWPPV